MASWKCKYISKQIFKLLFKYKYPYYNNILFSKLHAKNKKNKAIIYNKSNTIMNFLLGSYLLIYKGKLLRELRVPKHSVGFKLGEFAMTRKPFHFTPRIKKKK